MSTTSPPAVQVLHRLLFDALLEMRAEGAQQGNKVVFHLADLFHNVVLEMEHAAEGKRSYEDILALVQEIAREKKCQRWVEATLTRINERAAIAQAPQQA